jgi:hypothetical protein
MTVWSIASSKSRQALTIARSRGRRSPGNYNRVLVGYAIMDGHPGQRPPAEVTFLAYRIRSSPTPRRLTPAEVRSALTNEGELPEDRLSAIESDTYDVFLVLVQSGAGFAAAFLA